MFFLFTECVKCCITWLFHYLYSLFAPKIRFSKEFPEAITPTLRDHTALGYTLYTPIDLVIKPKEQKLVNTGLIFEIPSYLGMFILGKSSLAYKCYLSVCAGVIDPNYRGCVSILLENIHPQETMTLPKGSEIAQAVFHFAVRPEMTHVMYDTLTETEREERGFGDDVKLGGKRE